MKTQYVYILFAADADSGDAYALDAYAVADSYDTAEAIAEKDCEDGQIHEGWHINKFPVNTKETI